MRKRRHTANVSMINNLARVDPFVKHHVSAYGTRLLKASYPFTKEFLAFVLTLLGSRALNGFLSYINGTRKKNRKEPVPKIENQHDPENLADDILRVILQKKITASETQIRKHFITALEKKPRKTGSSHHTSRKLSEIANLFGLNCHEVSIVTLLYCCGQYSPFEKLFDSCKLPAFLQLVSVAIECPMWQLRRLLAHKGKLITSGVISELDAEWNPIVRLDDEVIAYLAGIADIPLAEKYCRKATGRTLNLKQFNVPSRSKDIAQALISLPKQCHMLLHGSPGTGKTEFAKSIIASTGKKAFFVQHGEGEGKSRGSCLNRKIALQAAVACAPKDTGVLVVDEADELLNTRYFMFGLNKSVDKGWLNMFMDTCDRQIIWITNDTDYMEESTQRRFSYSLHFKRFTRHEREHIWLNLLKRYPLRQHITNLMVRELADKYPINASGIASALDTLKTIINKSQTDTETVQATLTELLDRHAAATGRRKKKDLNTITDHYDVTALNVDIPPARITRGLKTFWANRKHKELDRVDGNMNLLFWGKPGTGKTEYAKFLAQSLSVNLMVKRASDLISMWVGGTESNIRGAFEEANRDKAILFLDEADSLFINRETAVRSWETSQTNELLTQMENHNGVLICCTNLLEHLDRAVARRFIWKVHFKALSSDGKLALYRKYFTKDQKPVPSSIRRQIASIPELTPGDIKIVWQKFQFADKDDRQHGQIVEELEKEVAYKHGGTNEIGFCT